MYTKQSQNYHKQLSKTHASYGSNLRTAPPAMRMQNQIHFTISSRHARSQSAPPLLPHKLRETTMRHAVEEHKWRRRRRRRQCGSPATTNAITNLTEARATPSIPPPPPPPPPPTSRFSPPLSLSLSRSISVFPPPLLARTFSGDFFWQTGGEGEANEIADDASHPHCSVGPTCQSNVPIPFPFCRSFPTGSSDLGRGFGCRATRGIRSRGVLPCVRA